MYYKVLKHDYIIVTIIKKYSTKNKILNHKTYHRERVLLLKNNYKHYTYYIPNQI